MAAPTLFAEGGLTAVTSGNLTVTLPAHQADDILIVNLVAWVPNTAGSAAAVTPPAGWTEITALQTPAAGNADGYLGWYWKRATSGAETNPTFTRPAGWDTGTDGVWSGRAYTVRGCETSGTPWDAFAASSLYNTANQACAAVTVSGTERTVIHFQCEQDNLAQGTMTGWTPGTAVTDTTGTDSGFKTHRKENVSTSTTADASTAVAPAQGFYAFLGISFKPPATGVHITGSGSPVKTLSKTASGTAVLKFNASGSPTRRLSANASGTAVQKFNASGSPVKTLSATASGTAVLKFNASGSPAKTLSATASGTATMTPDAPTGFTGSGSPVATLSSTASGTAVQTFNASGSPARRLSATASGTAVQKFNASGSPVKTLSATASGAATMTPDAPSGFTGSGSPVATLGTSATGSATLTFNASGSPSRRLSAFATGTALNPNGAPPPPKKKARGYLITEEPAERKPRKKRPVPVVEAEPLPDAPELPGYEKAELQSLQLEPIRWNPITNRPVPVEEVVVEEIDEDEDILLQILAIL